MSGLCLCRDLGQSTLVDLPDMSSDITTSSAPLSLRSMEKVRERWEKQTFLSIHSTGSWVGHTAAGHSVYTASIAEK